MIVQGKREAIYLLHTEGMKIREISRRLHINRNTVRAIIRQKGEVPDVVRKDKIGIDPQLVRRLHGECSGWIQRIHEKLSEEEGIQVGYSTLTRIIRELDLGQSKKRRCFHVPDEPGAEMQHDTSSYKLTIGHKQVRIVGSLLYFRYSKMRYVKFYRSFNRFRMKCFFHEALSFFGYSAPVCIIDNTNLARLRGTGKNAVIVAEMEQFTKQFGFEFVCHEVNHPNRKAGNERGFYTIETNFFPGRTFDNLEDLNTQAYDWATIRMAQRAVGKTALMPTKAFEYEKAYLVKVPLFVPPPYLIHKRGTDQYGNISFDGNFYWVPGTSRNEVTVLQYADCIKIYLARKLLTEYHLPPSGIKNKQFSPKGVPRPKYKPKDRRNPTTQEEKKLRSLAPQVDTYLNFVLAPKGKQKHRIIRQLFGLYQKVALPIFIKTIERALKYRITDPKAVERIAVLHIREGDYQILHVDIDEEFKNREAYLEGRLSDEADLSVYEKMLEDDNDG